MLVFKLLFFYSIVVNQLVHHGHSNRHPLRLRGRLQRQARHHRNLRHPGRPRPAGRASACALALRFCFTQEDAGRHKLSINIINEDGESLDPNNMPIKPEFEVQLPKNVRS
jgi:hypothetical protein